MYNNNHYCFFKVSYVGITVLSICPDNISFKIYSDIMSWVPLSPSFCKRGLENLSSLPKIKHVASARMRVLPNFV